MRRLSLLETLFGGLEERDIDRLCALAGARSRRGAPVTPGRIVAFLIRTAYEQRDEDRWTGGLDLWKGGAA